MTRCISFFLSYVSLVLDTVNTKKGFWYLKSSLLNLKENPVFLILFIQTYILLFSNTLQAPYVSHICMGPPPFMLVFVFASLCFFSCGHSNHTNLKYSIHFKLLNYIYKNQSRIDQDSSSSFHYRQINFCMEGVKINVQFCILLM